MGGARQVFGSVWTICLARRNFPQELWRSPLTTVPASARPRCWICCNITALGLRFLCAAAMCAACLLRSHARSCRPAIRSGIIPRTARDWISNQALHVSGNFPRARKYLSRHEYTHNGFGLPTVCDGSDWECTQRRLKLTGVMWTVIGNDWRWDGPRVARLVIRRASNGGILCLHDGRGLEETPDIRSTLEAVEYFVPKLQDQGYKFETVSEILCPKASRPKMSFRA